MQKRSSKFMIGALVGSTVGALTTLLFNTQEGKRIQKKLMHKFHEMHEKTGHFGVQKWTSKIARKKSKARRKRAR